MYVMRLQLLSWTWPFYLNEISQTASEWNITSIFTKLNQANLTKIFELPHRKSSLISQLGESQNGCFKKKKARHIFRKTNISYPLIRTRTYGVRNVRFSKNLACFVFLKHPFWDSLFYRLNINWGMECVIALIVRLTLLSRRLPAQSLTTETLEQGVKYVQS